MLEADGDGARPDRPRIRPAALGSAATDLSRRRSRGRGLVSKAIADTAPDQIEAKAARPPSRRDLRLVVLNWFRELTLVPVIVGLLIAGTIINPIFFTSSNLINTAHGGARCGLCGVAEARVTLHGH